MTTTQQPTMTVEQELAALRAENAMLKAAKSKSKITAIKVSQKGAISVYGLNRQFPTTLYASQWQEIFARQNDIIKAIQDNMSLLAQKQ